MKHFDRFLLLPIITFSILFLPFISIIPYIDGNIDFLKSYDFFTGGIQKYLIHWSSSPHPPFKFIINSLLYIVTGVQVVSFNLTGFFLGITGILAIYYFVLNLFNKETARIAALLFALSPMIISVGFFSLNDYVVTVLLLVSLYFYLKQKYVFYVITASCLVLSKETGLLLPLSIVLVEILYLKHLIKQTRHLVIKSLLLPIPLFVFAGWLLFLNLNHIKPWSDYLFTPTANLGTFYTIVYNLMSFHFLNQYAFEQWLHLFILNFNWVYWLLAIAGVIMVLIHHKLSAVKIHLLAGNQKTQTLLALLLFSLSYFFTVLTLQTYTIPRYILPMYPLLFLLVSICIERLLQVHGWIKWLILTLLLSANFAALFYSIDPLSKSIWGETVAFDQTIYGVANGLSGNDAITYNMQYLFIVKKRTEALTAKQTPKLDQSSCAWLFVDPRNDNQTIKILHLTNFSYNKACLQ